MRVAIIGAGTVGSALGKTAVTAGHTVSVSATSPKKAVSVGAATGARAAANHMDAVSGADLGTKETAAAQTLQRHLPNYPVVNAVNTVFAGRLGNPVEQGRHVH
ncbi:NAD(P)-binding domain-containing protein [Streptomyces sp. NPDC001073]